MFQNENLIDEININQNERNHALSLQKNHELFNHIGTFNNFHWFLTHIVI